MENLFRTSKRTWYTKNDFVISGRGPCFSPSMFRNIPKKHPLFYAISLMPTLDKTSQGCFEERSKKFIFQLSYW